VFRGLRSLRATCLRGADRDAIAWRTFRPIPCGVSQPRLMNGAGHWAIAVSTGGFERQILGCVTCGERIERSTIAPLRSSAMPAPLIDPIPSEHPSSTRGVVRLRGRISPSATRPGSRPPRGPLLGAACCSHRYGERVASIVPGRDQPSPPAGGRFRPHFTATVEARRCGDASGLLQQPRHPVSPRARSPPFLARGLLCVHATCDLQQRAAPPCSRDSVTLRAAASARSLAVARALRHPRHPSDTGTAACRSEAEVCNDRRLGGMPHRRPDALPATHPLAGRRVAPSKNRGAAARSNPVEPPRAFARAVTTHGRPSLHDHK
jgi:hypothetical protein